MRCEDRIAGDRPLAELAAFPFAEEHLAEIGFDTRCEAELGREGRRGLVRARQRGDVDRVDRLVLEAIGEQLRLLDADRVELGIAVAVDEWKRTIRMRGPRLAVPHQQHRRRAGRRCEAVLAESLGGSGRHPDASYRAASMDRRVIAVTRHVGLADVRPDGRMRLDAIARVVQDVADADAEAAAGVPGMGLWILRRMELDIAHTPHFRAELDARTWCSGVGARWAERSTEVDVADTSCIRRDGDLGARRSGARSSHSVAETVR